MEAIAKGYPEKIARETDALVSRYNASRDQNSPQASLKLWKESQNEPLSRFARSGEGKIVPGEHLEPHLAFVAALAVALKIHSQFAGISAILERLPKPASHSAVVVAERHLLEAIGYNLVGDTEAIVIE